MADGKMSLADADRVQEFLCDEDAAAWERYWEPVFAMFARDLVADASPRSGDLVLNVGTGSGVAAIQVCRAARSVCLAVGIDRSESMIHLARRKAVRAGFRNARFHKMNAEDLRFPDGVFDVVISNCGIGVADFTEGIKEALRVLSPSGIFVFNDWHLIDVKPHQIFGEILGKYRTEDPSPQLARERSALAATESFHHSLDSDAQRHIVNDAGFTVSKLTNRKYGVRLTSLDAFLKMRLSRLTIRREMSEMSQDQRKSFLSELRKRLRQFILGKNFVFNWNVFYISARKPS